LHEHIADDEAEGFSWVMEDDEDAGAKGVVGAIRGESRRVREMRCLKKRKMRMKMRTRTTRRRTAARGGEVVVGVNAHVLGVDARIRHHEVALARHLHAQARAQHTWVSE
jgi:hypothetical protein